MIVTYDHQNIFIVQAIECIRCLDATLVGNQYAGNVSEILLVFVIFQ